MVRIVENLDTLGRIISSPSLKAVVFTEYRDLEQNLSNNVVLSRVRNITGVKRIIAHRTFYHSADKETYGIVQLETTSQSDGVWVTLSTFRVSAFAHFELLRTYMTHVYRLSGDINIYFPIFGYFHFLLDGAYYPGFIVLASAL